MAVTEYPLLGFMPDAPANTLGALTSSSQIVPTDRGIGSGVAVANVTPSPAAGNPCGGFVATLSDGTERVLFGTPTALYKADGTDLSGGTYNASAAQTWSFGQFGDMTLAVNRGDPVQSYSGTGTFAAIAGAPKANIIIVVGFPSDQNAMAFDYIDGSNTYRDGVWWSADNNMADWSPAIATGAGNDRLEDEAGPITAAIAWRDGALVFKQHAMYLATKVGPPDLWRFERISSAVGCVGKNALCHVGDAVCFMDTQGVWIFDGSSPRLLPGSVHRFLATNQHVAPDDTLTLTFDPVRYRLWVRYNDDGFGSGVHLVYNPRSNLWTNYGVIAGVGTVRRMLSANYALMGLTDAQVVAIQHEAGAATPIASFQLGAHGKPWGVTTVRSVRLQVLEGPDESNNAWMSGALLYGKSLRGLLSTSQAMTFVGPGNFYAANLASRYLAPQFTISASLPWECSSYAIDAEFNPAGEV